MTHLHFDHCGGSVNWNAARTGYEVAFKTQSFGQMTTIGNGQLSPIQEKKLLFTRKHYSNARKRSIEFYQTTRR